MKRARMIDKIIQGGSAVILLIVVLFGLFSNVDTRFLDIVIIDNINIYDIFMLLFLGFLSGTVGGLLGMGGGMLKITNLHLVMGFDILFARVIALLSLFIITVSAYFVHKRYDLILWDAVKMLIPAVILGAVVGVIIGNYINQNFIEIILGFYALFCGLIMIIQIWSKPTETVLHELHRDDLDEIKVSAIGISMGTISSLLGISGGIVSTPLQQSVLKLPLKNSIANTVTVAMYSSFVASMFVLIIGLNSGDFSLFHVFLVTVCLLPGSYAGGHLGGYLTHILPLNVVRAIFAVVAFLIGFKILILVH